MNTPTLRTIEPYLSHLSSGEMLELAEELISRARAHSAIPKQVDWSQFVGNFPPAPDAVTYQREVRADWE